MQGKLCQPSKGHKEHSTLIQEWIEGTCRRMGREPEHGGVGGASDRLCDTRCRSQQSPLERDQEEALAIPGMTEVRDGQYIPLYHICPIAQGRKN